MSKTTMNFVQRVIASIKGSDESKVLRFQKIVIKDAEQQIKAYKDQKEELEDRISDSEDSLNQYLESVPMEKIGTGDDSRNFSKSYINDYMKKKININNMRDQLEDLDIKIKEYEEFITKVK